jgi:hypothetical protein
MSKMIFFTITALGITRGVGLDDKTAKAQQNQQR